MGIHCHSSASRKGGSPFWGVEEGLRQLVLLLSHHAFVHMPFKGLFRFEKFFFMLVDTISFS
jgi:hypothetical protein